MTKRSIPINDKQWDVTGQFAETKPVYEVTKSSFQRQLLARLHIDQRHEPVSKQMERKRVEKIDGLIEDGLTVNDDAYLRSVQFHYWENDRDNYFYWDLK